MRSFEFYRRNVKNRRDWWSGLIAESSRNPVSRFARRRRDGIRDTVGGDSCRCILSIPLLVRRKERNRTSANDVRLQTATRRLWDAILFRLPPPRRRAAGTRPIPFSPSLMLNVFTYLLICSLTHLLNYLLIRTPWIPGGRAEGEGEGEGEGGSICIVNAAGSREDRERVLAIVRVRLFGFIEYELIN